ncbi:hypothetical protein TSA1_00660 [Bradyrhizobium nitroreducens]|uniref:Uncharacterized protein n=1 Tax=Bradyrhizobium nitroreducens TaxID=709803 RepID=A0A2M6U4B9_9BRAD|nr:hypothetical protein [Bradyrhizobium nitroreducens]PIS99435.1 hypothetical protein TSA1_00660 [Bradyrhizobium nitroreducens]
MRTHATTSGTELLLSVIAIRLAVLVVVGWGLTLLPQRARNRDLGCADLSVASNEAKFTAKAAGPRIIDAALDDMLRHD